MVLFLFTGLALKVYLNERPFEPRERDYAVVGSFYVFAMWIGFGVFALFEVVKEYLKPKLALPVILVVTALAGPILLATQNWDDHDRSGRYTANSMGKMYLDSCDENAILFTIGDNDTFALWYQQNIEQYRQDVRIVNTSLFQTDWYIDQMKRKAYESDPIPSQLTHDQYRGSNRDVVIYREISEKVAKDTLDINQFMDFVGSEEPTTKLKYIIERRGEDPRVYPKHLLNSNYFPTRNISVPVDKESVLRNGIVKPKDTSKIENNLYLQIDGSYIYKNRLLMLDIIANNNWERPIYFSGGAFSDEDYIWLKDYLQLDGMCYKLVPIKTPVDRANPYDMGRVDADLMYDLVKSWDWGGSGEDIYHDIETRRNGITYRGNIARLIEQLINEDKLQKAEEIADIAMDKMPVDTFSFYSLLEPYISTYYEVGNSEKARNLFKDVAEKYQENLMYLSSQSIKTQERLIEEIYTDIQRYRALVDVLVVYDKEDFVLEETKKFNSYLKLFDPLIGPSEEDLTPSEDIDINSLLNDSSGLIAPEKE